MINEIIASILLVALVGFFLYSLYRELFRPMVKELIRGRREKKQRIELLERRMDMLDAKQEVIRKALGASERITNEVMDEVNRQKSAERASMAMNHAKK